MSKTAAAVLIFIGLSSFSIPMSAQFFSKILPNGNVYAGGTYSQLTDVVNKQSYKGWIASAEDLPFSRVPHLGLVLEASGNYRSGVTQYIALFGPRLSGVYGKWRPFVHAMGGIRHVESSGIIYNPVAIDFGGGADYKIFKSFSWRLQGDYTFGHYSATRQNDERVSTGLVWRF